MGRRGEPLLDGDLPQHLFGRGKIAGLQDRLGLAHGHFRGQFMVWEVLQKQS